MMHLSRGERRPSTHAEDRLFCSSQERRFLLGRTRDRRDKPVGYHLFWGLLVVVVSAALSATVLADYVGSLVNRVFLDPASIPAIIDGYQNGDEIAYILETTPRDTGSNNGVAAWMTLFVPDGVEVIGASFVTQAPGGSWVDIPAEDGGSCWLDCGQRNCDRFDVTSGSLRIDDGAISEVNHDSGIFYSTDSRTVVSTTQILPALTPTGPQTKPAVIFNQWDYDQVLAFGVQNTAGNLSGNDGSGNTPLISLDSGSTWAGTGSMVAGPDTYYTNDYNPACDCTGSCGGSSSFDADAQCVGPWNRIAYANSQLADSAPVTPSITASGSAGNTSVATAAGYVLSSATPLPAATNAIRWVHGVRALGDLEYGRVAFRITDVTAFLATFTDDTFCVESTGGDRTIVTLLGPPSPGKDNPWRYYEPEHKCFADLGGPGADGVLLKQVLFVGNSPSGGAFLSGGDVISWQITFTNTNGGVLTDVMLEDTPDLNVSLVEPGAEALCHYASYDGNLPGPAYTPGSATAGTATWATIASLPAGGSVTVSLCGTVSAGVLDGDLVQNTAKVTYTLPGPSTEMQTSTTTGIVADCLQDSDCPDDGDFCTVAVCNSGDCESVSPCGPSETCCEASDSCVAGSECCEDADCQAAVPPCEGGEVCSAGVCVAVTDPTAGTSCDLDGDFCTIDECNGLGACVSTGSNVTCQDAAPPCEAGEACNPSTGSCDSLTDPGAGTACDLDGNLCTIDECNGNGACISTGGSVTCQDAVPPCEAGEVCNTATGNCDALTDPATGTPCDLDSDLCTIDECNGSGACVSTGGNVTCQAANLPCEAGEVCNAATGNCDALTDPAAGTGCDLDTNLCTIDECDGNGACVSTGGSVTCQDANPPCEAGEVCNIATGNCDALADPGAGTACDLDSNLCTIDECNGSGACVSTGGSVICQDAVPPCEAGEVCNIATGNCDALTDPAAGTACDLDSNLCTIDACNGNGACVSTGGSVTCQDAAPPCEAGEVCNIATGNCDAVTDPAAGTACDLDSNLCTIDECDGSGACISTGGSVTCQDAALPCEAGEVCNTATGNCDALTDPAAGTACDLDATLCTIDECNGSGACISTGGSVTCQDAAPPCEAGEVCNAATGNCDPVTDPAAGTSCDLDSDLCTIDECDGSGACVFTGGTVTCQGSAPCESGEVCNTTTGNCEVITDPPPGTACDLDGNLCTIDECDGSGTCVSTGGTVACQDAVPPCEAGEACNTATGNCAPLTDAGAGTACDLDANLCTVDECDGSGTCVSTGGSVTCQDAAPPCEAGEVCNIATGNCDALTDPTIGTACDLDSDLCTIDECNGSGSCVSTGGTVACQDAAPPCEAGEVCNSATGNCDALTDPAVGTACDLDSNLCTIDECNGSGTCISTGGTVVCQDAVPPCEAGEVCNTATGNCDALTDAGAGTACDLDSDLCTIDECNGSGTCVSTGGSVTCQDAVPPCEAGEVCNIATGNCDALTDAGAGIACDLDANLCTVDECNGSGACVSTGGSVTCQDAVPPCEAGEVCNTATGKCDTLADPGVGTECDLDSNLCTIDECDGSGTCISTGGSVTCQDAVPPCEAGEVCNTATGKCDALIDPGAGTACDLDSDLCTIDECNGNGACIPTGGNVTCQDAVPPCEAGEVCNTATGNCDALTDAGAGTACDLDTNLCTIDECNGNGACISTGGNVNCQDADPPCEAGEVCNIATGNCDALTDPGAGTACDLDADLCTIDECDGNGSCISTGGSVTCQDAVPPCEAGEVCNTATGNCDALTDAGAGTACDLDTNLCTIDECDGNGSCISTGGGVTCQDAVPPCEAGEVCNVATGNCDALTDAGAGTACDLDADLCTIDECDGNGSCISTGGGVTCQDAYPPCEAGEVCNIATGNCDAVTDPAAGTSCDLDASLCTIDECDGSGTCVPTGSGVTCQDADPPCDAGEVCNPATGACDPQADPPAGTSCPDDGLACTGDVCDGAGACSHPLLPDGTLCRSAGQDACDLAEVCTGLSPTCPPDVGITECIDLDGCCPVGCVGDDPNGTPGNDNDCGEPVPTVSAWGLMILALLLLVASKVYFRRQPIAVRA